MRGLKKLVGISLQEIQPDSANISRLLIAAARNLSDAGVTEIKNITLPWTYIALDAYTYRFLYCSSQL